MSIRSSPTHSVHCGLNTPLKHYSLFFAKPNLKPANCPFWFFMHQTPPPPPPTLHPSPIKIGIFSELP